MFEWKVEDRILMNQKGGVILNNREKIYDCENKVSREDKIAFVDSMQDGALSYLLDLIEQFDKDKSTLPKNQYGIVKTVSLKAWIRKHDIKYNRPIIDDSFCYGRYCLLGIARNILYNKKGILETYEDLVDELFHRQLKKCEELEWHYFRENDNYSILKTKLRDYFDKYETSFGALISFDSKGEVHVVDENDSCIMRKITIQELKELIYKYEQVHAFIAKLTKETHIVC